MTTLKVFISSRMAELAAEREAVAALLPTLDFNGITLEAWRFEKDAPASSKTIREVYLDALYNSDLVIGLFWQELGEWTADEILKASEHNIERHIYLKKTSPDADERSPELQRFLESQDHQSVRFGVTIKWFFSIDELLDAVRFSIEQWLLTRQMRRNNVSAVMVNRPQDVPDQARRLIGQDHVVTEALDALDYGDQVLLAGLGGVGKSVVAAETARQYLESHPGDVLWVELGDGTPLQVFDAMARVIGEQRDFGSLSRLEREQAIRHMLHDMQALIVFDDVWNVASLQEVLRAVPKDMPVLATSRLRIPIDMIIDVKPLVPDAALELLTYHSRNRQLAEDPGTEKLISLLGAHPYALEIAGRTMRLDRLDATTMADRLENAPHRIQMPANFGEAGRTGIKSLLDASIDVLTKALHHTFMVMGGMFQPSATAEFVAMTMQQPLTEATSNLDALVERGLVERIERGDSHYYRLHDLAFSYAGTLLNAEMKDWDVNALLDAAHAFVAAHGSDVDMLDIELGNLLEAAMRAPVRDKERVLVDVMATMVNDYLTARGHTLKFLDTLLLAIKTSEQHGSASDTLHLLYSKLGNIYYDRGDNQNALNAYSRALELARHLELKTREVVLLASLGKVYTDMEDTQAVPVLDRAEELAVQLEDEYWLGMVNEMKGYNAQRNEEYQRCLEIYEANIALGRRIQDPVTEFFALLNVGSAERKLNMLDTAIQHHDEALQLARQYDVRPWVAFALNALGEDHHENNDPDMASNVFNEALHIYDDLGLVARSKALRQYMKVNEYEEEDKA